MAVILTSPITGLAQTGLTSPTYTHVADVAPSILGRQYAVTALGGTQTGVTAHSASAPFTLTVYRPAQFKQLGKANPVTGVIANVPRNVFKFVGRKGVLPLAGQPYQTMVATLTLECVAGSDTADSANVRALLSALFGAVSQQSAGFGDMLATGIM
jgi:hypothetical protein